jgi:hypothetical protein
MIVSMNLITLVSNKQAMTRFFLPITLLFLSLSACCQELSQVMFSGGTTLSSFSFITDQKIVIRLSVNGSLLEWGTDPGPGRYNYYSGKLQPYMGRVDYYSATEYDSLLRGKVKSIGTCAITYYSSSEQDTKAGKIKSIGSVALDYYNNFENQAFKGKLKSAGYISFEYYSSSENEAYRGNLKSVGNTPIVYYSTFDDKLVKGKIKGIGSFTYTWYSSHDSREFQGGGLKSGPVTQNINGVTYIVR